MMERGILANDYKCNREGTGYQIREQVVTAFEERKLFLKNDCKHETGEKASIKPKVGTSRSSKAEESSLSTSENKRKAENIEVEDLTTKTESNVKRIKNESSDVNYLTEEDEKSSGEPELFFNQNYDLVRQIIFAQLNVKDLKSCRQVNHLWYFEATKMLLKRDSLAAIQISDRTVAFQDASVYKPAISLQDFRNIIQNSKLFPTNSFSLGEEYVSKNIIDFFRDHGHLVKSFYVEPKHSVGEKATGDEILLLAAMNFPNLRKFSYDANYRDQGEPTNPLIIMAIDYCPSMENLNTLELFESISSDVISRILQKASNLENIYFLSGDYDDDLEKLIGLGNVIPRLKNINLLFPPNNLKIYEELLKQNPRFSSIVAIGIERWYGADLAPVGRFLTALFHQCSESLTEILGVRGLGKIPGITFPVFSNLKRLGIESELRDSLPCGVNLDKIFPNLTTLETDFTDEGYEEEIPASLSPMLSVRHLQVKWGRRNVIPDIVVERLCSLLPNVTSAKFCEPVSESAYEYIWKLRKLQDLHLKIATHNLDSVFTGFSEETVENLSKIVPADLNLSPEEVAALRIKPSIVDLKELRQLSLGLVEQKQFYHNEHHFEKRNPQVVFESSEGSDLLRVNGARVLSHLAKRFGFDLCPKLRSNVSVGFTYYTKLHPKK